MVYSSRLRKGIGELRAALESAGLGLQDARFARHGEHAPDVDAPLIMVSCSGGRDSMALAAVAAKTCASLGLRCGAIIIDHQLQQGSAGVARATADRCVALGLDPVRVRAIDVPDSRGIGVEAAAREARYHAIVDACSDASAVLLAHTKKRSGGNRDHRFVAFRGPRCGLRYERFLHTRRGAFSTPMAECDPRRNHRHLRGSAACLVGRSHKWAGCGRFGWK